MAERIPRNLILAFDGTKNEFGHVNTNVVNLCAVLKMDDRERQMVYYQPGIGTYTDPSIRGTLQQWWAKTTDLLSAWYLSAHVMRAYEFLMENYLPGDSIMLFGFSRGAYTARALAGMLEVVGLLSRGNREQVPFAYSIYESKPKHDLAPTFKETFCVDVEVKFLGLWDTVASMGFLFPQQLPLISYNTVKYFRHAISLDETRARFNVTQWHPAPKTESGRVKEMWFVGGHCDVGGGNPRETDAPLLANIPFRWMLHEIQELNIGVLFDNVNLDTYGIPTDCVKRVPGPPPRASRATDGTSVTLRSSNAVNTKNCKPIPSMKQANDWDVRAETTLELKPWSFWWLVQFPVWTGKRGSLFYWGKRVFPEDDIMREYNHIHPSVREHVKLQKSYKPNAVGCDAQLARIDGQPDTLD